MTKTQFPLPSPRDFHEGHLAAIVAGSSDAIVSKDLNGTILSWNAAAERLFGWPAEEIVGKSIRTLIPDSRQSEEDTIISRISAGEIVENFETWRKHKQGHIIPISVTVSPIRNQRGEIIAASKIARDISDQHEIRRQLAESENRFRLLADNMSQLAWIADASGSIYWYNKRWYDYTGTTLEDMRGWGWRKVHHPDHVDNVVKKILGCFQSGEIWEDLFPLRGADGQFRWFLSRARPIFDDDGVLTNWFGTNTDITEQRENEEHVKLLLREVNHRAKNMLAVIQSVVSLTATNTEAPFVENIRQRISALAANQDLLSNSGWTGAPVMEVLKSQLSFLTRLPTERIEIAGKYNPVLEPAAAETIGLAIHELAVNSTKYGALSSSRGHVRISSNNSGTQAEPMLRITWQEIDGPEVSPPQRCGFGTTLILRNPQMALNADVTLDYAPQGVSWDFSMPIATSKVS